MEDNQNKEKQSMRISKSSKHSLEDNLKSFAKNKERKYCKHYLDNKWNHTYCWLGLSVGCIGLGISVYYSERAIEKVGGDITAISTLIEAFKLNPLPFILAPLSAPVALLTAMAVFYYKYRKHAPKDYFDSFRFDGIF